MDFSGGPAALLDAFRHHFARFKTATQELIKNSLGDSVVAERLGDDLDEFLLLFQTVSLPLVASIPGN